MDPKLGLHDNPWICDCRLFDLVQCQKSPSSSSVAFIDIRLRCSDPESLSGVLFSDVDLRRCQGPRVHTAVARVRSAVGNNVLLRCGTIGVPIPALSWRRADGKPMNGTAQQEASKEGVIWSILSIPAVSFRDSGKYICKATNFVGSAEAVISLVIPDSVRVDNQTNGTKKAREKKPNGVGKAAYQEKLVASYIAPTTTAIPTAPIKLLGYNGPYPDMESYTVSDIVPNQPSPSPAMVDGLLDLEKTNFSNLPADASSLQQDPDRVVRSVKVIGDTDHTVLLNWRAPTAKNTTAFSVLYAVFGERDMRRINVGPGKNRIAIQGLVPKTKYIACVCVKGLIPRKEQCVIFSTDVAANANGTQKLINRRCKKLLGRKSKEIQDSCVTFETLSPGSKAKRLEGEYLTRLNLEESNRLLSARSSVDSEATAKNEGQPNEYFC
ncbi:hypothetical protein AAFF_G00139350 [Aldrovandia affinis]|uniref:Ig-like domain-containing protein n=1 Tax=Aldrovandia affinis TaxID=143900 RepID=A0AAD7X215_9TELE|nr:hypothetical protein AAFF_G00139350 [Aldrovandia affinis]